MFARSFARIHRANLFNFGIVPLTIDEETYERIERGDDVTVVDDVSRAVDAGQKEFTIRVNGWEATATMDASRRERDILCAGGKLSWTRRNALADDGDGAAPADD